ncbi:MAG: 30S ribosomal protein S8 [Clostridiales bacterium]|jgi:small subunit ribosomal protein S8|nr:30S ribosomal protein S8 [Clostridiales bacterium]
MAVTDPIADFLTRIRNAQTARHKEVLVPASRVKKQLADILLEEGYVKAVEVVGEGVQQDILITLKYGAKYEKVITSLERISKPGLRIYAGADELPKVLGGLGIALISTPKGIMTDKKARALNVGGEVLAFVY